MVDREIYQIETANGHRLCVSRHAGPGLPIVFLASMAADHSMWGAVRMRLDRASVAYDARGHGRSDVAGHPLTIGDLATDTLAVLDACELERAAICGLSLGGLTAMQVAADAPERVAGLVLANTAVSFGPPSLWRERAKATASDGWSDLVEPTLERWLTEAWRRENPRETAEVRAMLEAMSPQGYIDACAALETGETSEALRRWDGPTLVIAGAHDQSSPVSRSEELVALSPGASLTILDTAHIAAIEDPDGFARALEDFASTLGTDGG